jgi:hypothetical protein
MYEVGWFFVQIVQLTEAHLYTVSPRSDRLGCAAFRSAFASIAWK